MSHAAAVWVTASLAIGSIAAPPAQVSRFLEDRLGFSAAQLRLLAEGEAVVRSLDVADSREVVAGDGDGDMDLAYVNRSRVDVLTGMFGGMKRALLRSRVRGTVAGALAAAQRDAERRFRDQAGGK